ncbi:Outer membrane receptor proteins, mostly Fe transport [Microbulbifer donghaiensis]|uniref:Outer membrane receptor proteins, mostly Fe transport n=1 Tax=Microbulbifer donghaiensis TaxID=494016 RepID=A0A1M4YIH3_9GAMM|nr:TonB-dependent receptor [Microbulbifer donghaiensis]SHF05423.1 Outer membrane receptor proteins, mostly Fe transport [Microbulbifer donghaiensis]
MQPSRKLLALAIAAAVTQSALADTAQETDDAALEEVVVTGSRIQRSTFETPSPTSVIDSESIKMSGELNLNEVLSTMPQFGEGFDSTSGSYSFGNSGLNALNLRDLGVERTLALVNGHRPVQITADDNTMISEIGMIPSELVERVEVLTGGASAVYGADAVAGVVNFILKDDYEGISLRSQFGDSEAGGGANKAITLTLGENFADGRGNFAASIDYFEEDPLYFRDRKDSAGRVRYVTNPENTGPDDGIPDQVIVRGVTYPDFNIVGSTFGVWNGDVGGLDWYQLEGDDANLRTPAASVADGWKAIDGSGHDPNAYNMARGPYERLNGYSRVHFDLTDSTRLSADLMFSKTESYDEIDPDFIWGEWTTVESLQAAGMTVPDSVLGVLDSYGDNWLNIPYTFDEAGPRWHTNEREYLAASVSLQGEFGNGWNWDTYLTSGYTKADLVQGAKLRYDRLNIDFANGNFETIGPCEAAGNCPEFSFFEPASQELIDYVMTSHTTTTDVEQHGLYANVSGDLFKLPAGDVMFSAGAEARYESLDYQPSELWQSGLLSSQQTSIDDEGRSIKEVYGELLVPLLADVPLVKKLELETAVRGAEYSTESANFTSWKAGLNWALNDSFRIRSVYSKAVRAPQLGEMFLGTSVGYAGLTDPCDVDQIDGGPADGRRKANCQALGIEDGWDSNLKGRRGQVISEGNEDLNEEEATTLTLGFVFTPGFVDGLNMSVDYYDIDLTDMIVRFGANSNLSYCVDLESINNDFCAQVQRAADGDVLSVRDTYVNADGSRRRGVDLEADYLFSLADTIGVPGDLRLNLIATRQLESSYTSLNIVTGQEETTDYAGNYSTPEWKGDFTTTYSLDDLTVRLATKYTQGGPISLNGNPERFEDPETPDSLYFNLWTGYRFTESTEGYLGINNLTDERWTDHPYTSYGSANYSLLGRYLYAGVTVNF